MEVMLAVVILGMSMTVFFSAANQGVDVVVRARGYQDGRELLNLVELREPLDLEDFEEGVTRGRLDHPELGSFEWVRDVQVEGPEEDELFRIITSVEGTGDRPARESKEEFLYLPVASRRGWVEEPWDE
jgi:hypothetical protein